MTDNQTTPEAMLQTMKIMGIKTEQLYENLQLQKTVQEAETQTILFQDHNQKTLQKVAGYTKEVLGKVLAYNQQIEEQNRQTLAKCQSLDELSQLELLQKSHFIPDNSSELELGNNIIDPPFSMHKLGSLVEISSMLKVCIRAMEKNGPGAGYYLEPLVKLFHKEVVDEAGNKKTVVIRSDTGAEADPAFQHEYDQDMRRLVQFLASAPIDELCWEDLMNKKTVDRHTFGAGYVEVERDLDRVPVGVYHAPALSMRKCKKQRTKVPITQKIKNPLTFEWEDQERTRRFRKYAQVTTGLGASVRYFKEYGDPRRMDAITGMYFDPDTPIDVLPEKFEEANEIIEYSIYSPMYAYGVPWWIATSIWVLSLRAAELVNYFLLKNNAIPPGMLVIEGYKDQSLEKKLKEDLTINMSGAESYSSFLVVSVEAKPTAATGPGANPAKPSIRFESFSQLLNKEGMFMDFMKMGEEKQVGSFGLANQYVGKNNDLNRAVAEVAQDLTEMQVFIPERNSSDAVFNNTILADLGIKYWVYRTKSSTLQDPELLSKITNESVLNGSMTRNEARPILSRITREPLDTIPQDWANQPQAVWAQLQATGAGLASAPQDDTPENDGQDERLPESEQGSNQVEIEKYIGELGEEFSKKLAFDMIKHLIEARDGLEVKAMHIYDRTKPDGQQLTVVN